jgi:hypothetical protein
LFLSNESDLIHERFVGKKKEVEDLLLNCIDQEQTYLQSFVVGCLKENENCNFYSPISRSSLKTFEDSKRIGSDLQHLCIDRSSWKIAVGIGPTGYAKTFSTLTSSRTSARAKALLLLDV